MDGKTDGNSFQECAAPDSFSLFMFGKNSVHQMFSVAKIPQFYSHHMQKKVHFKLSTSSSVEKKKSLMDICENAQSSALVFVIFLKQKIPEKIVKNGIFGS